MKWMEIKNVQLNLCNGGKIKISDYFSDRYLDGNRKEVVRITVDIKAEDLEFAIKQLKLDCPITSEELTFVRENIEMEEKENDG